MIHPAASADEEKVEAVMPPLVGEISLAEASRHRCPADVPALEAAAESMPSRKPEVAAAATHRFEIAHAFQGALELDWLVKVPIFNLNGYTSLLARNEAYSRHPVEVQPNNG